MLGTPPPTSFVPGATSASSHRSTSRRGSERSSSGSRSTGRQPTAARVSRPTQSARQTEALRRRLLHALDRIDAVVTQAVCRPGAPRRRSSCCAKALVARGLRVAIVAYRQRLGAPERGRRRDDRARRAAVRDAAADRQVPRRYFTSGVAFWKAPVARDRQPWVPASSSV